MGCAIIMSEITINKIPVCIIIISKNEESNIARCLDSTREFSQVIVVDSQSTDKTCEIARSMGAQVIDFKWNGKYPKKRGWCLDNLNIKYDWVFWLDADEVLTNVLVNEIRHIFQNNTNFDSLTEKKLEASDGEPCGSAKPAWPTQDYHSKNDKRYKIKAAGFFIKGRYVWGDRVLRYGLCNNKIALMNIKKMEFPVINDLDIEGMGEIEGHYQPVFKKNINGIIGQIKSPLLHYAYDDKERWLSRHRKYANWEAQMIKRGVWSKDPIWWREFLKKLLRRSVFRPYIMFIYSYILKLGFLDGVNGYEFALSRKKYCDLILKSLK